MTPVEAVVSAMSHQLFPGDYMRAGLIARNAGLGRGAVVGVLLKLEVVGRVERREPIGWRIVDDKEKA